MPNRLTKIVTRGGDKGETSLADGARVSKADPRIALIGEVDELNSWLGVILAHDPGVDVSEILTGAQHDLFDLGGALSMPGAPLLADAHLARVEAAAQRLNEGLPPLKEFVLPGGAPIVAFLHVARTVCRRVERAMAAFVKDAPQEGAALAFLNRLSDLLFIAARVEARRLGAAEVYWRKERSAAARKGPSGQE